MCRPCNDEKGRNAIDYLADISEDLIGRAAEMEFEAPTELN